MSIMMELTPTISPRQLDYIAWPFAEPYASYHPMESRDQHNLQDSHPPHHASQLSFHSFQKQKHWMIAVLVAASTKRKKEKISGDSKHYSQYQIDKDHIGTIKKHSKIKSNQMLQLYRKIRNPSHLSLLLKKLLFLQLLLSSLRQSHKIVTRESKHQQLLDSIIILFHPNKRNLANGNSLINRCN